MSDTVVGYPAEAQVCAIFFQCLRQTSSILWPHTRLNILYLLLTAKFTKEVEWKNLLRLLLIGIRCETPFISHMDTERTYYVCM